MTSRPIRLTRLFLWVTLILCVYAAAEAADEVYVAVQLLKALFSLDVTVGG